eukprot:2627037-Rhodomonas_salina.1
MSMQDTEAALQEMLYMSTEGLLAPRLPTYSLRDVLFSKVSVHVVPGLWCIAIDFAVDLRSTDPARVSCYADIQAMLLPVVRYHRMAAVRGAPSYLPTRAKPCP